MKKFKRVRKIKSENDKQIKLKVNFVGNVLILLSIFLAFIFQKDGITPNQYLIISSLIILIFNFIHILLYMADVKKYKVAYNWYTVDFVFRFLCISLYLILLIIGRAPTSLLYPDNGFDANTLYINSLIINIVLCVFDIAIQLVNLDDNRKENKKWNMTFNKLFSTALLFFFVVINLNVLIGLVDSCVYNIKHANDNKFYNSTKLIKDTFELGEEYPTKKELVGSLKYDNINDVQIYFFSNYNWNNENIDNNDIINIPFTTKKTGKEEKKVSSEVGNYQYAIIYNGEYAVHQIKVLDTKGPTIVLKDEISIPENQIDDLNNSALVESIFVKSCKDFSGSCKYSVDISFEKDDNNYKIEDEYIKLILTATDKYNNETKIEKNITITVTNRVYYFYDNKGSVEVKNNNLSNDNYLGSYKCNTNTCYFIQYNYKNDYIIMSEKNMYGIYDVKNKKQLLKYDYEYINYNDGYYLLQQKDNYLILDEKLNPLINKPYSKIYDIVYDNDKNQYYYLATSLNSTEIDLYTLEGIFVTSLSNYDSKKYFYESGYSSGKIYISLAYSFGTKENACDKYYYDINSGLINVDTDDVCK